MTLVDLAYEFMVLKPIPFVMECTVALVLMPVQRNLRTESNPSSSCTDVEVVEVLIQRGCNVTIGDKDIWTSFLSQLLPGKCCVTTPSNATVQLNEVTKCNGKEGYRPLDAATWTGHPEAWQQDDESAICW